MKISKRLLISLIGLSLSLSATAIEFKDKLINVGFVQEAKVTQLQAQPELQKQPSESIIEYKFYSIANLSSEILTFDYGGDMELQVNSNKLAYRESNVFTANFAKVQNQNFERMAS